MPESKGRLEAAISDALIQFEKEYMGRGPTETRTFLVDNMVIVRLRGVITRAEYHLANSDEDGRGRELIKETRMQLIEKARPVLESAIREIVGVGIQSLHTDISTRTGERLIVFTLEGMPDLAPDDRSAS
ncbi:MAG: DUF2294 domain-containing protein [Planctomycetota bacterium]